MNIVFSRSFRTHSFSSMDDYDPLEAFLKENESQKAADDSRWLSEVGGLRSSMKRDSDAISISVEPQQILLDGLKKPMSRDNFGMRMLEKMGFHSGQGLGKNGGGIKEPIEVQLKYDKVGIGHMEAERKQKEENEYKESLQSIRRQIYLNMKKQRFEEWTKEKANMKQVIKDIREAQGVIETLDEENDKPRNPLLMRDDEECDIDVLSSHLKKLLSYLRSTYFYCIYCGYAYSDPLDLETGCPGCDRSVH